MGVGITQGWATAVHFFGALIRALIDSTHAVAVGVGLDPPPDAVAAWRGHAGSNGSVAPSPPEFVGLLRLAAELKQYRSAPPWSAAFDVLSGSDRQLLLLDLLADVHFLILQFVDDTFVAQSTASGLAMANKGLSTICDSASRHSLRTLYHFRS